MTNADAVGSRLGQLESQLLAFAREKLMRDLNQNAGTVPGLRIAAASATMRQVQQDLDSLADNFVTLVAVDAGYKSDTAGIVLVRRIIKALGGR